MSRKIDYSKKILKILAEKPAVAINDIELDCEGKEKYAITRSLKGLREAGLIENISSDNNNYARLTKDGKKKVHSIKLDAENAVVNTSWDGLWRIILIDLPEDRKAERESLRYLLKKAGFFCLKNSAWVSPYPFEYLFTNIKKDLNLSTELIILVTSQVDEITEKELRKIFGL
jgi:DNA-binding transcriptional regulator PaaX